MKTRVVGYIRVSTEGQASEGVSLAAQRTKLEAYAVAMDLKLVAIVEERGRSAKSLKRPGLQRALAMLEAGEASALLVTKLDRLTRSVRDLGELVDRYFSRHGLLSVGDSIDTRTAGGRLVLNVLASVSQWEREAIGERTREALTQVRRDGGRLGAPGLGWTRADARDDAGRMLVAEVKDERATVARILALRSKGRTLRQIAETLASEGRKTKRGGAWAAETVRLVIARSMICDRISAMAVDVSKARLSRSICPIGGWVQLAPGIVHCDPMEQGSAFFVTNSGVFVTAKHVLEDRDGNDLVPFMSVHMIDYERSVRHTAKVVAVERHPVLDVAIGVAVMSELNAKWRPEPLPLADADLEQGQRVICYGFSRTHHEVEKPAAEHARLGISEGIGFHFEPAIYDGEILEVWQDGDHPSVAAGPLYVHNVDTVGGISGAPLISPDDGCAYGVNVKGTELGGYALQIREAAILDWRIPFLPGTNPTLRECRNERPDLFRA